MGESTSIPSPEGLRAELVQRLPALETLDTDSWSRLARLADASPLYARLLNRSPELAAWLSEEGVTQGDFNSRTLRDSFDGQCALPAHAESSQAERLAALRSFRTRISMRIAYREVNKLCNPASTVEEMSLLAELCIEECLHLATTRWSASRGIPWDQERSRPARLCVLALGKLGGRELNFSSDIDLIFFYEGEGFGLKDGTPTASMNPEIFARITETTVRLLQESSPDGFLFRVDLRLRPEGDYGPIVGSLSSLENYYATSGQTWERLALIKARPVAGDKGLGEEFLESVQSFRYPRHPPRSVLQEVAAMKARTEREVVGSEALQRDIKSGFGGIREIEFRVQCLQMIHAGRFPFLQTGSTIAALTQLARYELLEGEESSFLEEAYWFLRAVEHRIQMREERQTHQLPASAEELAALARSLGFGDEITFCKKLEAVRKRVHKGFSTWFEGTDEDDEFNDWWSFLTTGKPGENVTSRIGKWFDSKTGGAPDVQLFARGNFSHPVTRELVSRFIDLARSLDAVMPGLARPAGTLRRLAHFAETYGTRQQFFNACALNPQLLRVIALLFDRSEFIFDVLRLHPEILEEVLRPEILRKKNDREVILSELKSGAASDDFADWLWHYVKAEQIRLAIGALLGFAEADNVEQDLSLLADSVLEHLLGRHDSEGALAVIALGKFGGRELTHGSDLDIILLSEAEETRPGEFVLRALQKELTHKGPLGSIYELDLRLRPHGAVGPLISTLKSLAEYHSSDSAQQWEKQLLTRARFVAGNAEVAERFERWRTALLFNEPSSMEAERTMWAMRLRIERDRDRTEPPERAFKSGPGGLVDIEFAAQILQLRHGAGIPALRSTNTKETIERLITNGIVARRSGETLIENLAFLKRIERNLRRDTSKPAAVIENGESKATLASWLGFSDQAEFWDEHVRRMNETRQLVVSLLAIDS